MFNTFKHGMSKISYHQIQTNQIKTSTIFLCNYTSKNNLFKFSVPKFFSTKANENLAEKSKDFFDSNFRIEKSPEHITTVSSKI